MNLAKIKPKSEVSVKVHLKFGSVSKNATGTWLTSFLIWHIFSAAVVPYLNLVAFLFYPLVKDTIWLSWPSLLIAGFLPSDAGTSMFCHIIQVHFLEILSCSIFAMLNLGTLIFTFLLKAMKFQESGHVSSLLYEHIFAKCLLTNVTFLSMRPLLYSLLESAFLKISVPHKCLFLKNKQSMILRATIALSFSCPVTTALLSLTQKRSNVF